MHTDLNYYIIHNAAKVFVIFARMNSIWTKFIQHLSHILP